MGWGCDPERGRSLLRWYESVEVVVNQSKVMKRTFGFPAHSLTFDLPYSESYHRPPSSVRDAKLVFGTDPGRVRRFSGGRNCSPGLLDPLYLQTPEPAAFLFSNSLLGLHFDLTSHRVTFLYGT